MKNYIAVTVEVENSASHHVGGYSPLTRINHRGVHIETFHEKVKADSPAPLSQAIANVADKLEKRGVAYPRLLNYNAY